MVNSCVCAGCVNDNSTTEQRRLHNFPKDRHLRRQWIRFVGIRRANFPGTAVTRNSKICGDHFRETYYDPHDVRMASLGLKKHSQVRLLPTAIPSVHTYPSSYPTPSPKRKRSASAIFKREFAMVSFYHDIPSVLMPLSLDVG